MKNRLIKLHTFRLCFSLMGALSLSSLTVQAQDSLCAQVKIEIIQELTLERQAFEARMRINNGTANPLENVNVAVNFLDAEENPVVASSDPNNTSAKFFIRTDSLDNISNVSGSGTVPASSSSRATWLIIPAQGTGGQNPFGTLYFVGATLTYTLAGEEHETEVTPDFIYVKPMPNLILDYFLPNQVYADDPFTLEVEPSIPFPLGVRVKNTGFGTAKNLKIDSGQPRIIENELGLLIDFQIIGSEVNGEPFSDSLLVEFGDIQPDTSGVARWSMITTLSGQFVDFSASFSHADELGGELTSLIESVNTHLLLSDVLVDLPGRDTLCDFLAMDGDVLRVYESENVDTVVNDVTTQSSIASAGVDAYTLTVPVEVSFLYAQFIDPTHGDKALVEVIRDDGKLIKAKNAWQSQTWDKDAQRWDYFVNLFEYNANTAGVSRDYTCVFADIAAENRAPVLAFIGNKVVDPGEALGFLVNASDPDGVDPDLFVDLLPGGAKFVDNGDGTGLFTWTPLGSQEGAYLVTVNASDGELMDSESVVIVVGDITTPYGNWAETNWPGESDPTVIGMDADPDKDGRTNLMEYALNSDPTNPHDFGTNIFAQLVQRANDDFHNRLTFYQRTDDTSLQYVPQVSSNRESWFYGESHVQQIGETSVNDAFKEVIYEDLTPLMPGESRQIRLQVIQNEN